MKTDQEILEGFESYRIDLEQVYLALKLARQSERDEIIKELEKLKSNPVFREYEIEHKKGYLQGLHNAISIIQKRGEK